MMKKQIYTLLMISTVLTSIFVANNLISDNFSINTEEKDNEIHEFDSIITYRNDDVDEATSEEFQRTNKIFVENDVPITHGIVPLWIKERNDTQKQCREFRSLEEEYPELVHFSLHGYTHNLTGTWPSEFYNKSEKIQKKKVSKGVKFFEECLGRSPETFIPPGNLYDKTTKNVLSQHNFMLLSGYNEKLPNKWNKNEAEIPYDNDVLVDSVNDKFVISWQNRKLASSDNLKHNIRKSTQKNNLHTQMLHYKTFSDYETRDGDETYENLVSVLEFSKELDNTTIMNLDQISNKLESEKLRVKEDGGWEVAK